VGEQRPSFVGEQTQRGLSLVAVLADTAHKRPLLPEPVIALLARQYAQLGERAGGGDGQRGRG
jgi:hypothetical protein